MSYTIDDFHVGDIVRVRQWDDMVKEFGLCEYNHSSIDVPYSFVKGMRKYCGKEFEIKRIGPPETSCRGGIEYEYSDIKLIREYEFEWNTLMIEPAQPAIQFDADCFAAMLGGEIT